MINPTLTAFIRKEFKQSLRDPTMKQLLFVTPVIILMVFGFALVNETRHIRLAVRMEPKDAILREVYEKAIGTGWFLPANADPRLDPSSLIETEQAEAVIVSPPGGLTEAVGRQSGELQLLVDGTDVLRAQAIEQYMRAIAIQVATRASGNQAGKAIQFSVRTLYNPSLSTAAFMLPGTMMLIILQITVVITSMAIAKEKETGTFETMISAPITSAEIIFGKTLPYVVLGMVNVPVALAVVHFVFHVPIRGSLLVLFLTTLVFVCVTVAVGALVGTVTKTQQQSFMLSFLFVFPGVLMSGMFFPVENMPTAMKVIAYINPMTHFLGLLRNLLLKGGSPTFVGLHVAVLLLMGFTFGFISFKRMHTTIS